MPHAGTHGLLRPAGETTERLRRRRIRAALGMLGAMPLIAMAAPAEYLCRSLEGFEQTVSREAARTHRQAGLACLPIIAQGIPSTEPFSHAGHVPDDESPDIITLHIGITDIAAHPAGRPGKASAAVTGLPSPPASIVDSVRLASQRQGIDPALVAAVMYVESRYRPEARSPKGALGLMQVMLSTARQYGVHTEQALLNPHVNIDVGARHLRSLIDRFGNRLDLVLAAYNAGEGAVLRHGHRIPPYAETRRYVDKVLSLMLAGVNL